MKVHIFIKMHAESNNFYLKDFKLSIDLIIDFQIFNLPCQLLLYRLFSMNFKTYIAEIGGNHNGDLSLAKIILLAKNQVKCCKISNI